MRDVIPAINQWLAAQKSIALATVIQTWGSAPRKAGSHMAITENSEIAGSVSGGCVEGAVVQAALEVLKTGTPQLLHFGVANDIAWDVGLACGGEIDIFVQPLNTNFYQSALSTIQQDKPLVYETVISGDPSKLGNIIILGGPSGIPGPVRKSTPEKDVFTNVIAPKPTLIIVGGVQIAIALAKFAAVLDYKIAVVDPRKAFGSKSRFPEINDLFQIWPQEAFEQIGITASTAIATLTHDPKIDDPALAGALNSDAFYIGALGSKKTQASRKKRLLDQGFTEDQISRIKGPIGFQIGAQTPEEIALSIMAEIIAEQHAI